MKRTFLSLTIAFVAFTLNAAPRSIREAQDLATRFLGSSRHTSLRLSAKTPELTLAHTATYNQQPVFYVFNQGDKGGVIFVSADDNAREILGYAKQGDFDENAIPDNMRIWLQHYAEEIAFASKKDSKSSYRLLAFQRAITPVEPLLGPTEWNQGIPYNNNCPIDKRDQTRCFTGCVATAVAQIMRFWKHPTTGTGKNQYIWKNFLSDNPSDYIEVPMEADFSQSTYNWSNMLFSYKHAYTPNQAEQVAKLLSDIGIACNMQYGGEAAGGSGAYTSDAQKALYTYFGYDKASRYIHQDLIGKNMFEKLLFQELANRRPVLMGGSTTNGSGHSFVCDGVNEQGYVHINWGWGGMSNNYFALSALDPEEQGAGGAESGYGFSVQVEAIIGIQPDKGNPLSAPLVVVDTTLYSFSKLKVKKTETITFTTEYGYNYGPSDIVNEPVVMAVYDTNYDLVKTFGSSRFSIRAGWDYYTGFQASASFDNLAEGNYLLALAFRTDATQDYTPIPIVGGTTFHPMIATADSIFIEGQGEGSQAIDNISINSGITKQIINGQLIITKDKQQYNALGQKIQ